MTDARSSWIRDVWVKQSGNLHGKSSSWGPDEHRETLVFAQRMFTYGGGKNFKENSLIATHRVVSFQIMGFSASNSWLHWHTSSVYPRMRSLNTVFQGWLRWWHWGIPKLHWIQIEQRFYWELLYSYITIHSKILDSKNKYAKTFHIFHKEVCYMRYIQTSLNGISLKKSYALMPWFHLFHQAHLSLLFGVAPPWLECWET